VSLNPWPENSTRPQFLGQPGSSWSKNSISLAYFGALITDYQTNPQRLRKYWEYFNEFSFKHRSGMRVPYVLN
jgi:hypothetical protein